MFTVKKVYGLSTEIMAQWEEVENTSSLVSALFRNYRQLIVTVEDSNQPGIDIHVNFETYRAGYSNYNNTIDVMLQGFPENTSFEVVDALPQEKVGYVRYNHFNASGWHAKLDKCGQTLPEDAPVALKEDIRIFREEFNTPHMLQRYCLMSVNGMMHAIDYDGEAAFVYGGGTSTQIANNNQMGIHSFMDVSRLDCIRLTDEMIRVPSGYGSLKERIEVVLPPEKKIKAFFLILGGYYVLPHQNSLWVTGDNSFHIDINHLQLLNRVLESRDLIDLSSLELSQSSSNDRSINIEELYSDDVLRRYMKLKQSFVVLLDVDNFFHNRTYIRQMRAPGLFTTYTEPKYPLLYDFGRVGDYWKYREDTYWGALLGDSFRKNYQHRREDHMRLVNVDGSLAFDAPFNFSQAYLLEMGSYKNRT